jgi:hypothetical protein
MQVLNYMSKQQITKHLLQSTRLTTKISSNAAKFINNNKSPNFVTVSDFNFSNLAHMSCSISGQNWKSLNEHRTILLFGRAEINCISTQHICDTPNKNDSWYYNLLQLVSAFFFWLDVFSLLWYSYSSGKNWPYFIMSQTFFTAL